MNSFITRARCVASEFSELMCIWACAEDLVCLFSH